MELLAALLIVAILMSLLTPALAAAVEMARRTSCLNNLSQVSKSFVSHDSSFGHMPGWRSALSGYTEKSGNCVSWAVSVLPFLGEKDAYAPYELCEGVAGGVRVPKYICPSSEAKAVVKSCLSYAGNGGTGCEEISGGNQYKGDGALFDAFGNSPQVFPYSPLKSVYLPARSSFARIAEGDGCSSTALLSERSGRGVGSTLDWSSPTPAAARPNASADAHVFMHPLGSLVELPDAKCLNVDSSSVPSPCDDWAFRFPSSGHGALVCMSFCDGRTQAVSEGMDPWVYAQVLSSDHRKMSDRAASWELRRVEGSLVRYSFDHDDLSDRR